MTVLSITALTVFVILLIEFILQLLHRIGFDSPLPYGLKDSSYGRLGYIRLKPDYKGKSRTDIVYTTNSNGYRDDEIETGKKHILFLGDSTTFGVNINHEDTYPEVFERLLNQAGSGFQSVNTASPGQGTFEQLNILNSALTKKELNITAIVLGFFGNDFSDNYSYKQYESREKIGNGSFKIKTFIKRKIGIPRTYLYLTLLRAAIFKKPKKESVKCNTCSTNDPRPEGQGHDIALNLLDEEAICKTESWNLTIEALNAITGLCAQKNILFIFIYLPSGEREIMTGKSPRYKFLLEKYLELKKIPYVDVMKTYRGYLKNTKTGGALPEGFYSLKDDARHPGVLACKLIADELFLIFRKEYKLSDKP